MQFKPIIALCDKHAEELKEHLQPMPEPVEQSRQEKLVRACCDADYDNRQNCQMPNYWFYLDLELTGWRHKQAGAKGGSAKTTAKVIAARENGAKGGRPRKHLQILE